MATNDPRKQLLLDSLAGQSSRRVTRQKVSATKAQTSQISDRTLQMMQQSKNHSSNRTKPSNKSTTISKETEAVDSPGVAVAIAEESPEATDEESSPYQPNKATKSPARRI